MATILTLQQRLISIGIYLCLLIPLQGVAQIAVPPLQQRVTDLTATLDATQRQTLEETLRQIEVTRGAQVAVLIVSSTQPETIEEYALRVAETWQLGRKGIDDGVLLVVAKQDRALRFEVGYGLEGAMPDAVTKRIISETITPYFKRNDFYGGIDAGMRQVARLIEGERLAAPEPEPVRDNAPSGNGFGALLIAALAGAGILRGIFGRLLGATLTAGLVAFLSWFLFSSILMSIVIGVLALVFALFMGSGIGPMGPGSYRGGGGWGTGGGGGFGGRGGGFGGGGASGRW